MGIYKLLLIMHGLFVLASVFFWWMGFIPEPPNNIVKWGILLPTYVGIIALPLWIGIVKKIWGK